MYQGHLVKVKVTGAKKHVCACPVRGWSAWEWKGNLVYVIELEWWIHYGTVLRQTDRHTVDQTRHTCTALQNRNQSPLIYSKFMLKVNSSAMYAHLSLGAKPSCPLALPCVSLVDICHRNITQIILDQLERIIFSQNVSNFTTVTHIKPLQDSRSLTSMFRVLPLSFDPLRARIASCASLSSAMCYADKNQQLARL